MGLKELAPGVVGGLLVSYHLRGGLEGAPSTEGGTAGGCEGSIMESCTGETLSALLRTDEDGVLAPLVLAMADVKKLEKRGFSSDGGPLEMVLWCDSISHLRGIFAGQITGAKWNIKI